MKGATTVLEEPKTDRREMLQGTKENDILPDGGVIDLPYMQKNHF